jgi:hypothetical protein
MVSANCVKKLHNKNNPDGKTAWSTPAGLMTTSKIAKCQFTLPYQNYTMTNSLNGIVTSYPLIWQTPTI